MTSKKISHKKIKEKLNNSDELLFSILHISHIYLVFFFFLALTSLALYIYGVEDLYSIWSFRIADPPWLPPSFTPTPVIGPHTFGDFQLPYYLAKDENTYSWSFYNATMPMGLFFYKVLTIFGVKFATFIFLFGSIFYFWNVLFKSFFDGKSKYTRYLATLFSMFSLPTLINLDRGGGQMLAYSLFIHGLILINLKGNNSPGAKPRFSIKLASIIMFSAAISIKIYLIIPFFLILGWRNRRFILEVALFALSSNILLSFLFDGPRSALKGLYLGYLYQTGDSDPGWIFNGVSLSKFFAAIYFYTHTQEETNKFALNYQNYVFVPGILYLFAIFLMLLRSKGDESFYYRISLSLTTIFLITPVSHSYSLVACSFIAVFSYQSFYQSRNQLLKWKSALLLFFACLSLMPIPSEYYLTLIPGMWLLHLLMLIALELSATKFSAYRRLKIKTFSE